MDILNQNYDAIIVGTGPGGASLAKDLSNKGKKVLVLEWGQNKPVSGTLWRYIREQCWPGKGMLIVWRNLLGMVRGITTGGSSIFYYGTCFPVPHAMLAKYGIDVKKRKLKPARSCLLLFLKSRWLLQWLRQ